MFIHLLIVSILTFTPSIQHFIPPLSNCLLADICNHTWIPECGDDLGDKRMFIDECDMYEYNCDFDRKYEITNYTDCFGPATGCPTLPPHKFIRVGNYQLLRDNGRRMIYAPTVKTTFPLHLRNGKRRYTPKPGRKLKTKCNTCKPFAQKPSLTDARRTIQKTTRTQSKPSMTISKIETIILQRVSVMKNGKMMIKVVKGVAPKTKSIKSESDSDFIE